MNKDPAIERMIAVNELTEILCGKPCDICRFYGQRPKCMPVYTAEKIVDAGWRKASEVAREIIEEAEKIFMFTCSSLEAYTDCQNFKKKYTEGKQ